MPRRTERKRYAPPSTLHPSYWGQDALRKETLLLAKLAQEPEPQPEPTPEPQAPMQTATTSKPKRTPKEPPPRLIELVFSPEGEVIELRSMKKDAEPITIHRRLPPQHAQ
jgi:hypothetical protein